MFKKIFYIVFLTTLVFTKVNAQENDTIAGVVFDKDKNLIENVNVIIKELNLGTSSNLEGKFEFRNIKKGNYEITVSAVGYETIKKNIEVNGVEQIYLEFILKKINIKLNTIVVTGTRTNKNLLESPIRTEVVSSNYIQQLAFTRLDQVLFEQPGIIIIDEPWGKGIQMQGLDPDYTLVLIDGEPLIGRSAGTLDLSRFTVSNLKQIEIIKGPSSSLYGSEALAGVINLITETPDVPFKLKLQSLFKTNNTINVLGDVLINTDNLTTSFFFDRLSSDGYDLTESSISLTVPKFENYSLSTKINYRLDSLSSIKFNGRIFLEEQKNTQQIIINSNTNLINQKDNLTDWNTSIIFKHKFNSIIKSEVKFYISRYLTDSKLTFQNNDSTFRNSSFDQYLYKGEVKNDFIINNENYIIAGGGYFKESVAADRIYGDKKTASSFYMFAQEEWIPNDVFDFVLGTRFDSHSEYASRLTPKFSVLIKPIKFLRIRVSIGGGFKAPTLQQLYLDFTNPQVGYSVFGSSNINKSFQQLLKEGQISRILIDPANIGIIRAENSLGYNLNLELTPWKFLNASINIFRNNVKDLIEASPIAVKTNGQNVFSYFNINKIYTQGIEAAVTVKPFDDLSFSISYQFLEAKDKEILEKISAGLISKVGSNGRVRPVQESEYGGLYNRSKHFGTVKINYQNNNLGLSANLRGVLRGKYGFGDINGNAILDDNSEYVPGYAIWNITLSKDIINSLKINFGIDNIFDKTNSQFIPSIPGRIFYGGIQLQFF